MSHITTLIVAVLLEINILCFADHQIVPSDPREPLIQSVHLICKIILEVAQKQLYSRSQLVQAKIRPCMWRYHKSSSLMKLYIKSLKTFSNSYSNTSDKQPGANLINIHRLGSIKSLYQMHRCLRLTVIFESYKQNRDLS